MMQNLYTSPIVEGGREEAADMVPVVLIELKFDRVRFVANCDFGDLKFLGRDADRRGVVLGVAISITSSSPRSSETWATSFVVTAYSPISLPDFRAINAALRFSSPVSLLLFFQYYTFDGIRIEKLNEKRDMKNILRNAEILICYFGLKFHFEIEKYQRPRA